MVVFYIIPLGFRCSLRQNRHNILYRMIGSIGCLKGFIIFVAFIDMDIDIDIDIDKRHVCRQSGNMFYPILMSFDKNISIAILLKVNVSKHQKE